MRVFDATTVKEPGKTGSLWRLHNSVRLPSLAYDHFKLTETTGPGTGESFEPFPLFADDLVVADRGYSTAAGLFHVASAGAHATVRVNTASLVFTRPGGGRFDLLAAVSSLEHTGVPRSWVVVTAGAGESVPGRVCALRKSNEAIRIARAKLRRKASTKGKKLKPQTLEYAKIRPADYPEWLLLQAAGIGTEALDWARHCLASRDFPQQAFRSVRGMVDLAGKHGNAAVEQACARCLGRGRLSAAAVRQEVQRRAAPVRQKPQQPIPDHPNVRGPAAFRRTAGGERS